MSWTASMADNATSRSSSNLQQYWQYSTFLPIWFETLVNKNRIRVYGIRQFRMYGVDARKWLQLGRWVWVCTIAHSASVASFLVSAGAAYHPSLSFSRECIWICSLVRCFVLAFPLNFSDSVEHDDREDYYSSACKIQQCLPCHWDQGERWHGCPTPWGNEA